MKYPSNLADQSANQHHFLFRVYALMSWSKWSGHQETNDKQIQSTYNNEPFIL